MRLLLLVSLLAGSGIIAPGWASAFESRTRLERRWPPCRGTLESIYAGDELVFLHRSQLRAPRFEALLLLEKDRGERWCDLVSGGVGWIPDAGLLSYLRAGWLRATLGTGLVLDQSGGWGTGPVDASAKPPARRAEASLSTSAGASEGEPLTAVAAGMRLGGVSLSLIQGLSWLDTSQDGLHRTELEIDSRAGVREVLSAIRAEAGDIACSVATGTEAGARQGSWLRGGMDWLVGRDGPVSITAEAAAGWSDSTKAAFSVLLCPALDAGTVRTAVSLHHTSPGFPVGRSCPPGAPGETGLAWGVRLRPLSCTAIGALLELADEGASSPGSAQARLSIEQRLAPGLAASAKLRVSSDQPGERYLGGSLGLDWQLDRDVRVSAKAHACSFEPSGHDSTTVGAALEVRLKLCPAHRLELTVAGAGYSTDDYETRIYLYEVCFPGQFGSLPVQGRGFLLQVGLRVRMSEAATVRARIGHLAREGAESMGSGYEETRGPHRTEVGLQLDWSI
ncbi:hypothetical protein JW921_06955 [Candidatus Fermentibacterales bacterium]|nr:hypothetical protein [Candidatus Fermentibacterales bacterium]